MRNAWIAVAVLAGGALGACAPEPPKPAPPPAPKCEDPPGQLMLRDLEPGSGDPITPRSAVLVSYTGWLYDPCKPDHKGAQFDSNADKRVPFGFRIAANTVIKGWDEGVPGMKEGGKRLLIIPAEKAYGAREIPGKIPANSPLVFEVTLAQLANIPGEPAPSYTPPPRQ